MGSRATLTPRATERLAQLLTRPAWLPPRMLRRALAGALAIFALVLALVPIDHDRTVPVLVAATDLAPGQALRPDDLAVRQWPVALAPAGVLHGAGGAEGRVLLGAARAGEPLTDVRLAGASGFTADADTAVVPVRLADPAVAALLVPGSKVDLVMPGPSGGEPMLLAADATVRAVLPAATGSRTDKTNQLILVTVRRELANRVASMASAEGLSITLR